MKFEFEKAFVRDFKKLKSKELASAISEAIKQVSDASTLSEINNLKKLSGYKSAFRIRIGDYRIGFELLNKTTIRFIIIAHRKDIYKIFP